MPTIDFSHYNLRAPRPLLEELRVFYCEIVGLSVGQRPPFQRFGYWLYAGNRDILHLVEADPDTQLVSGETTSFNHAAFFCTGRAEFERLLVQRGIKYEVVQVPQTGQVQLFFSDPAGNGVELNFENVDA